MAEGEPPVLAVAEVVLPIQFSVLVRPGTGRANVRTVATHPHAAAQVRSWLGTHFPDARVTMTDSTSAAAVAVRDVARPGPDPAGFTAAREWLQTMRGGRSA